MTPSSAERPGLYPRVAGPARGNGRGEGAGGAVTDCGGGGGWGPLPPPGGGGWEGSHRGWRIGGPRVCRVAGVSAPRGGRCMGKRRGGGGLRCGIRLWGGGRLRPSPARGEGEDTAHHNQRPHPGAGGEA